MGAGSQTPSSLNKVGAGAWAPGSQRREGTGAGGGPVDSRVSERMPGKPASWVVIRGVHRVLKVDPSLLGPGQSS